LKSPILQQKVIIADVPGGADVNYFRKNTADHYLQSCQMTIVVAKIDRITNDLSFRQKYVEAYRRRRSGSVILVGTKSDVKNLYPTTRKHTDASIDLEHRNKLDAEI
jgi:hypothetical protein